MSEEAPGGGMTGEGEGFGRRWSRLKTRHPGAVRKPAEAAAEPPEETPPVLESLALEQIAPWLKRRVPELWKQAALRRIWLGDPGIRNFIGPADYAWDWNTPGGAPGYGPMRAWDDLAALLDRAIGAPSPADPASEPAPERQAVCTAAPSGPLAAPAAPDPVPPDVVAQPAARQAAPAIRRRGGGAVPV
jgi:hypothetical protein